MSSSKNNRRGNSSFPSRPTTLSREMRALFALALSGSALLGGSYAFGQQAAFQRVVFLGAQGVDVGFEVFVDGDVHGGVMAAKKKTLVLCQT